MTTYRVSITHSYKGMKTELEKSSEMTLAELSGTLIGAELMQDIFKDSTVEITVETIQETEGGIN